MGEVREVKGAVCFLFFLHYSTLRGNRIKMPKGEKDSKREEAEEGEGWSCQQRDAGEASSL